MKNKKMINHKHNIVKKALVLASAIAVSLGVVAVNFKSEDPIFNKHRAMVDSDLAYIKNGDLVAYKPFVYYSIFGDEEYFNEDHFEFVLVVTDKN